MKHCLIHGYVFMFLNPLRKFFQNAIKPEGIPMKAWIGIMVTLLLVAKQRVDGQQIPNASFEDWWSNGVWEDPVGWDTPNDITFILGFFTVTKNTTAHTGLYSARLVSKVQGNVAIPGLVCTGVILDVDPPKFRGGFPLSEAFQYLEGYTRYFTDTLVADRDSFLVVSYKWKWNNTLNKRDTVAHATYRGGSSNGFLLFSAPFTFISADPPDSAIIIISSSKRPEKPHTASILILDQLYLTNTASSQTVLPRKTLIWPNPATDFVVVQFSQAVQSGVFVLYDATGKPHEVRSLDGDVLRIEVGHLPSGLYYFTLHDQGGRTCEVGNFVVAPR